MKDIFQYCGAIFPEAAGIVSAVGGSAQAQGS
jgi:hypothetical protein